MRRLGGFCTSCKAWWPEIDPLGPLGERREPTLLVILWHSHMHKHCGMYTHEQVWVCVYVCMHTHTQIYKCNTFWKEKKYFHSSFSLYNDLIVNNGDKVLLSFYLFPSESFQCSEAGSSLEKPLLLAAFGVHHYCLCIPVKLKTFHRTV